MNRSKDWIDQAKRDVKAARDSNINENFEWSCFQSQQSAEKALKALLMTLNIEAWGHSLIFLFNHWTKEADNINNYDSDNLKTLYEKCQELDRHYIQPRYPNGFASGHPGQFYNKKISEECIKNADDILRFVEEEISKLSSSE